MPQITRVFITLAVLFISTAVSAQKKYVFGKVSDEELNMTTYGKDTTAGAVILFDVGRFSSTDLQFRRHIRVKILKKSGLNWANWVFNTPGKGDFKVFVFNMVNGEAKREKAEGESIYTEKVIDQYEVYKVRSEEHTSELQ